jgi:hypothetical protein
MGQAKPSLRSQRLRLINHQGDALRLGMNWTEEDLAKPQVLVAAPTAWATRGRFTSGGLRRRSATACTRRAGNPRADYLVIQAPLTKETYQRIGEAELRRMKPALILVNTARGPIVKDDALYLALTEGWIAGAGLDDIEEEPAKQRDWKPANPLFGLDNVVITPMRRTTPKRRSARSATSPRTRWRGC